MSTHEQNRGQGYVGHHVLQRHRPALWYAASPKQGNRMNRLEGRIALVIVQQSIKGLMKEFRKVHQFVVFAVNTPMQYAVAEYLQDSSNYSNLGSFYQQKRDFFAKALRKSRFKLLPSYGTYFQLLDYSAISDET